MLAANSSQHLLQHSTLLLSTIRMWSSRYYTVRKHTVTWLLHQGFSLPLVVVLNCLLGL
jgi:hypothetical protein